MIFADGVPERSIIFLQREITFDIFEDHPINFQRGRALTFDRQISALVLPNDKAIYTGGNKDKSGNCKAG
jgi:hypothetical protein